MKRFALVTLCLLFVSSAWAADQSRMRNISIHMENDLFAGTDKDYTHGTKINYVSPDMETWRLPDTLREFGAKLPMFLHEGYTNNIGLSIGQNIYTPSDIEVSELMEDDRPYAGWLYGEVSWHHKNEVNLHKLMLTLGVVGSESLAEEAQTIVHEWTGSQDPKGWRHQLHNEPGLILSYIHKKRFALHEDMADFIPAITLNVGNVLTSAEANMTIRGGYNVPADFHSNRIGASGYAKALEERKEFSIYAFATAGGRAVARDIFLDGNTFRDSHSVDKKPLVGEVELGIGVRYRSCLLTYTQIFRTKEYDSQEFAPQFGSLGLSFWF